MKKRKSILRKIIKYALLAALGAVLFLWLHDKATITRGYKAYGGECALVLLPLLWWLIETNVRDTVQEIRELKQPKCTQHRRKKER